MNLFASTKAFLNYLADFRALPFAPHWSQFPAYVSSYIQGRMVSSRYGVGRVRPKTFLFHLNQPLVCSLEPSQFGMAKGVLIDREYSDLPLRVEPRRILDLGANIGLGLLALHDKYPQAELAGIEADPRNFPLLIRNLAANKLQVSLLSAAVSGEPGILGLRIGDNSACSTLIKGDLIHPSHAAVIDVPCLTMPQILERLGWGTVDLLKVDIEGAEEGLFSQSPQWLSSVEAIVLEIHPNTTPERIQAYLAPYGFHLRRQCYGREPVFFADKHS